MTRRVFIIFIEVMLVAAFVIYFAWPRSTAIASSQPSIINGVILTPSKKVQKFYLTQFNDQSFTQENLKGHWTMMFFGFTNCGYVCPTTLSALNKMYQLLERDFPSSDMPEVVMVTVDPKRDSLSRMKSYLKAFNPHFIGVRGNAVQTKVIENQLHIVAEKIQVEGAQSNDQYSINHSAEILVFNPNGELQAYLSYPHEAQQLAKDFKKLISLGHST